MISPAETGQRILALYEAECQQLWLQPGPRLGPRRVTSDGTMGA
jgi:hypothetical protein